MIIGDNVFIGSRAFILKNTKVGSKSVIGAETVVVGEFPEISLIAGNPANVIRKL
jgi:acetyltransferase-like isoleucine patch superfamily enzyme